MGVGGKFDPTRWLPHATTVITRLGLDHQAILGQTEREIARHKLGAINNGNLVVHAPFSADVRALRSELVAGGLDCRWIEAKPYPCHVVAGENPAWILETPWGPTTLALPGARAAENVSLALKTLEALGLNMRDLLPRVPLARWPGRMEEFRIRDRRVFLSGDHNVLGVESLGDILQAYAREDLLFVVGVGKNKSPGPLLENLMQVGASGARVPKLVLTCTPFRSSGLAAYGEWLERSAFADENPQAALEWALKNSTPADLIVVTGSLYLVGDLRRFLLDAQAKPM